MKVKLLRDSRPFGRTGETVEVSPERCEWLMSLGMAEEVADAGEQTEAPKTAEEPKAEVKQAKPAAKAVVKTEVKKQAKPAKKK